MGFRLVLRDINKAPIDLNSSDLLAIEEEQPVGTVVGEFLPWIRRVGDYLSTHWN